MTKLNQMNLPKRGTPMFYCEICREYVPSINKHNNKRHDKNGINARKKKIK